jgi:hypothetical protein
MATDYYITVPTKVRVADLNAINRAAIEEIAALRRSYPNARVLVEYEADDSPMIGLKWFMSPSRLQYLYGGIEAIFESADIRASEVFPAAKNGNHLHDWWLDEAPEYVNGDEFSEHENRWSNEVIAAFVASIVGESSDIDGYVIGVAENPDGTGQSIVFSRDKGDPGPSDTYCIVTPSGTYNGGLRECRITENVLTLTFSTDTTESLGVDNRVVINLENIGPDRRELLKRGLRRVLDYGDPRQIPTLAF